MLPAAPRARKLIPLKNSAIGVVLGAAILTALKSSGKSVGFKFKGILPDIASARDRSCANAIALGIMSNAAKALQNGPEIFMKLLVNTGPIRGTFRRENLLGLGIA